MSFRARLRLLLLYVLIFKVALLLLLSSSFCLFNSKIRVPLCREIWYTFGKFDISRILFLMQKSDFRACPLSNLFHNCWSWQRRCKVWRVISTCAWHRVCAPRRIWAIWRVGGRSRRWSLGISRWCRSRRSSRPSAFRCSAWGWVRLTAMVLSGITHCCWQSPVCVRRRVPALS